MVKRTAILLLAGLLWGCPDDIGGGVSGVVTGLRSPSDLEGVARGGSEIVLTWKDRATVETGYRVEMNFGPFGTPFIGGVEFLPADATTLVFPSFPNSTYYFRVFAVTTVMESDPSEVIVISTPDVPERPVGVAASPESTTQISVKWADVGNETGYRVEVSSDDGATWHAGATTGPNISQVLAAGLLSDSEFLVRVVASNAHGDSTPSLPIRTSTLSSLVSIAVASGANTGTFSSIYVTPTGVEHLSHFDAGFTNVLYTTKKQYGSIETTTVDAGPTGTESVGGDGTSIAVDGAGKIHIAAFDQTSRKLHHITNESGLWVAKKIEAFPQTTSEGAKPRILWDSSSGRIYYYVHAAEFGLTGVRQVCRTTPTSYVFSRLLPVEADHAATFSAAIDPLGTRHIALVSPSRELWHFHQSVQVSDPDDPHEGVRIPLPAPSSSPDVTSICATGSAVHVVFHDASSGSLHHSTAASGTWVTEAIDVNPGQDLGRFCAVAIHPQTGRLHVAYYDGTNRDLKYARKDPGGVWVRKVLDAAGDVGSHASIAVDAAGAVHIAYRDESNQRLKIATGAP